MSDVSRRWEAILNQSKYHHEHEKFHAKAPLKQAAELQEASLMLKTLADRWSRVEAQRNAQQGYPYMGSEDLNEAATIQHMGVLFMEGEEEPEQYVSSRLLSQGLVPRVGAPQMGAGHRAGSVGGSPGSIV